VATSGYCGWRFGDVMASAFSFCAWMLGESSASDAIDTGT
jgi:hypothetical protein